LFINHLDNIDIYDTKYNVYCLLVVLSSLDTCPIPYFLYLFYIIQIENYLHYLTKMMKLLLQKIEENKKQSRYVDYFAMYHFYKVT